MSSLRGKIGGALVKPALKAALSDYDMDRYGGAPMLGLNGLVVKAHGSGNATTIKNAIQQCIAFGAMDVGEKIRAKISEV